MDSDRILVMDAGKMVEFGHPYELIQKEDGQLKMMIEQTGSRNSNLLTKMAKENYEKNSIREDI